MLLNNIVTHFKMFTNCYSNETFYLKLFLNILEIFYKEPVPHRTFNLEFDLGFCLIRNEFLRGWYDISRCVVSV